MKKTLITFLIGLLVGSASYWTFRDGPLASKLKENKLVQKVGEAFDDRSTEKLKEEMEKQGKIVWEKPANSTIAPCDDSKLADLVKARIAIEPLLSDTSIKPEVKSGEVTLRGTASSYEQVARAIRVTLECGPTRTVISTIEVKAK